MLDDYLESFLEKKTLIDDLKKESAHKKIPVIGKSTGYFLEFLVKLVKPGKILEVGCGNGFSSYFLVNNMTGKSCYTGIDMNCNRVEAAKKFIGSRFPHSNHTFICGNAINLIPGLPGTFNLVFIDAAKFEYPLYLKAVKKKIKNGSVLVADDIFCKNRLFSHDPGKHYSNSVKGLKMYLEFTGPGTGFDTRLLDIDDGLAVSIYKKD